MNTATTKRRIAALEASVKFITQPMVYIYTAGEPIPAATGASIFLPSNGRENVIASVSDVQLIESER